MTQQFRCYNDVQSMNDFGQKFASLNYSATLAANTDTTLTITSEGIMGNLSSYNYNANEQGRNKVRAVIRCTSAQSVWMALNALAAVPAGASFAATTSELINGQYVIARDLFVGDVLHFITAASNVVVSVSVYALPA